MYGNVVPDTHDVAPALVLDHDIEIGNAATQQPRLAGRRPERQGGRAVQRLRCVHVRAPNRGLMG